MTIALDGYLLRIEIGPTSARLAAELAVALVDEVGSRSDIDADFAAKTCQKGHDGRLAERGSNRNRLLAWSVVRQARMHNSGARLIKHPPTYRSEAIGTVWTHAGRSG